MSIIKLKRTIVLKQQFETTIMDFDPIRIRSQKLSHCIVFTNKLTGENITIPFDRATEFAHAVLESAASFIDGITTDTSVTTILERIE